MRNYCVQYLDIFGKPQNFMLKCKGIKRAKEMFLVQGIEYKEILDVYLIQC